LNTLGDIGPYSVTSFGIDQHDELYICSFDGMIYKFVQTLSTVDHGDRIPNGFSLYQNFPNPFNPITTINYDLPENKHVKITIYNMLGKQIKILVNKYKPPGRYEAKWAGTDRFGKQVATGVYLVIMQTRNFSQARKIVYIK